MAWRGQSRNFCSEPQSEFYGQASKGWPTARSELPLAAQCRGSGKTDAERSEAESIKCKDESRAATADAPGMLSVQACTRNACSPSGLTPRPKRLPASILLAPPLPNIHVAAGALPWVYFSDIVPIATLLLASRSFLFIARTMSMSRLHSPFSRDVDRTTWGSLAQTSLHHKRVSLRRCHKCMRLDEDQPA